MWENGSETSTIEFGGGFSLIVKSLLSVVACLAEFGPRETQERSSAATGSGNQKSRRGSNALLHVSWVGFASGPSLLLLCTLVLALFGTAVLRDVGIVSLVPRPRPAFPYCKAGPGNEARNSLARRSVGTRLARGSGKKAETDQGLPFQTYLIYALVAVFVLYKSTFHIT